MPTVKEILERHQDALSVKHRSDGLREDVGRHVWPNAKEMYRPNESNAGQNNHLFLYDSTAIQASLKMSSGIFSYLMPTGARWFEHKAKETKHNDIPAVQDWLSKTTEISHSELQRTNFEREIFAAIRSLVVFGTACISLELSKKKEIVYRTYHIGDISFAENSKGQIDTVFRKIVFTNRQAAQEYGKDKLPKEVQDQLKIGKFDIKHEYVHAVYPREDFDPTKVDSKGKKFESKHIHVSAKVEVKSGGFKEMPYMVGRMYVAPGELWGRSPGTDNISEIKMLNTMKKNYIIASEKSHNPTLMIQDDGVIGPPVTGPGDVMYIRSGAAEPKPLQTGLNTQGALLDVQEQQRVVKEGFFNNSFDSLGDHQNMSATEAGIRREDGLVVVAPVISVPRRELFEPIIDRTLTLLAEARKIDSPPQDIEVEIVLNSRLALAMGNMQLNAADVVLAKLSPYAEFTGAFDNFDFDVLGRKMWLMSGAPADVLKPVEERDAKRKVEQEMIRASQEAEIAKVGSEAYRNATKAPEDKSPAGELL